MLAALGIMAARETEVHQGIEVGVRNCENVPPTTTVPSIGATKLFVFFMPRKRRLMRLTITSMTRCILTALLW